MMGAFQDQDTGVDKTRTCRPAPWCPGVVGEIPEGSAAGTAAGSPGHSSADPHCPRGASACVRESGGRRREEAQARCSRVCSPALSAASRGVDGSTTVRPPSRAPSAATRRCPGSVQDVWASGRQRSQQHQGRGRAAASACPLVLTCLVWPQRMSAKSKGTPSSSSPAEGPPAASKTKVKEQIKIIVEDLELVLGDLKDVAKELKEVVDQIDTLTSDLQLEDEMTDSSKTDTLNSSSSSTTASSIEKIKVQAGAPLLKPPAHPSAILTVLRKPNPPPPPPRLTPVKCEDPQKVVPAVNPVKTNGTLLRNGGLPGAPNKIPNGDICYRPSSNLDKVPVQPLMHRPEKDRCPQAGPRERVRFNEKVQYHGCCPDCDTRHNIKNREAHLNSEPVQPPGRLAHQGPPRPPAPHLPAFPLENGGLGMSPSSSFPPLRSATVPPPTAPKPQKTILRKSTTTTV
ncbi:protein Largen isoform 1-T1 [Rhynchonycteris naso]